MKNTKYVVAAASLIGLGFEDGTAIGGKALLLAAVVGLLASLAAVVKPERRAA